MWTPGPEFPQINKSGPLEGPAQHRPASNSMILFSWRERPVYGALTRLWTKPQAFAASHLVTWGNGGAVDLPLYR